MTTGGVYYDRRPARCDGSKPFPWGEGLFVVSSSSFSSSKRFRFINSSREQSKVFESSAEWLWCGSFLRKKHWFEPASRHQFSTECRHGRRSQCALVQIHREPNILRGELVEETGGVNLQNRGTFQRKTALFGNNWYYVARFPPSHDNIVGLPPLLHLVAGTECASICERD